MNAVDATTRSNEVDTTAPSSLLCVILDTNPHAWNLLSSSLPLSKALANVLVFLNAHLAINAANRVAVLASHTDRAVWLYPTPDTPGPQQNDQNSPDDDLNVPDGGPVQPLSDAANKYRPFALVESAIKRNLSTLMSTTTPEVLSETPTTMIAGALTLALTHISKLSLLASPSQSSAQTTQSSFNYSDPSATGTAGSNNLNPNASADASHATQTLTSRILVLSTSPENPSQYIPTMNALFAAQRLQIPIDVLPLSPHSKSTFLQQAADATGGLYIACTTPIAHAGLLQYLMLAFLPDATSRRNLVMPGGSGGEGEGVDFRAACFCHRRIVDVGYVCSICLSIFCEVVPEGVCLTCGSVLAMGSFGKKADGPKKKKKKKRVEGVEGSGAATPMEV
ncbi:hypothetical protein B0A48_16383 [Cryoendolithus antarcticus]|uniref:General transcription and DNA repair factor IIH subunit TFB4 n=1 Tax=Cryoendolithus antarcticus TaxID=1507870 RepID=A0A1V8SE25_9PEZI|nr:hypothetical protein B0A48_16383 [Cryoendolithus antarcticus]